MLHDWRIEPREYARHESRRGRRHAFERLAPERTALVVIDMVPFHVDQNPYVSGIVPAIARLADSLRSAGGTVAWVLPSDGAPSPTTVEFFGPTVAETYRASAGSGPLRDRLWPEFAVADADVVLEKSGPSAFFPGRCALAAQLGERHVDTVLITGTVANVCCESSARDANALGYRVIMVADANAAMRDEDLNATLHTIYRSFGDVRPTSEVLTMIGTG
jgi:nicotinamidase-related amidase